MTIVEFLRARLDEDERWALEASRLRYGGDVVTSGVHWRWECGDGDEELTPDPMLNEFLECPTHEVVSVSLRSRELCASSSWDSRGLPQFALPTAEEVTPAVAEHIARHDPARVLAEVDAKRRIVELHAPERVWTGSAYEDGKCTTCLISQSDLYGSEYETVPCPTLRLLALPYADHPDHQEEWRP